MLCGFENIVILGNGRSTRMPAGCVCPDMGVHAHRCVGVLGVVEHNVFVFIVAEKQGWKVS